VAGALADLSQLHVVSEILGHASIVVTKDVYGHLIGGDKGLRPS
jgi:integrase